MIDPSQFSAPPGEVEAEEAAQNQALPVVVFRASSTEEAEVVRATLEAAGIPAALQAASLSAVFGAMEPAMSDAEALAVYVAPSQADAALQILSAPPPSDEELAQEAESAGPVEGV